MRAHSVKKHLKIFKYLNTEQAEPGNNLIFSLQQDYREDVIDFLAEEIAECIRSNLNLFDKDAYVITNVPRRKGAIIKFGYDHTECLAKSVSKKLEMKFCKLLKSKAKHAQKETRGSDRMANAEFDYISDNPMNLKGKSVIIIDDIITTGASMGGCAMLIKGLEARECIAVSVASAYNDEYQKRINNEKR